MKPEGGHYQHSCCSEQGGPRELGNQSPKEARRHVLRRCTRMSGPFKGVWATATTEGSSDRANDSAVSLEWKQCRKTELSGRNETSLSLCGRVGNQCEPFLALTHIGLSSPVPERILYSLSPGRRIRTTLTSREVDKLC